MNDVIQIGQLFDECYVSDDIVLSQNGHEMVDVSNINVLSINSVDEIIQPIYSPIKRVIRHKVSKGKWRIDTLDQSITITSDHSCMKVDIVSGSVCQCKPMELSKGDNVLVYDDESNVNVISKVTKCGQIGYYDDEYVYDLEMVDEPHVFFANDILIHNSQYIDICNLTKAYCLKFCKESLQDFSRTEINEMLKEIDEFVENDINTYAQNQVNTVCHTTKGHHIQYEREVLASESIFFRKKHYLMHLIDVDGKQVDKFKYMGIAVKKGELPVSIKTFLKDIYEHTCIDKWGYDEYVNYLNDVYEKFCKFDYNDISEWKGYGTEKESTGFLTTQKGTLSQVRGIHYHNDLLHEFGILDKYNEIHVGDKVRFCYINQTNPYGIDVISYMDGQLPDEFKEIFTIDYMKMFNKLIIRPLKGYVEALNYLPYIPSNQMVEDIFNL